MSLLGDAHWYESQPTELDRAYYERNALVAALSKLYPSHVGNHDPSDANWEPGWFNIVFIDTPQGQLSWHMHESHMHLFEHLPPGANEWDGHTTVEKYERLAKL
jgi:hypothetical protein